MRFIGTRWDGVPVSPDFVATFLLAANTAQAADYPSNVDFAQFSAATTAGGQLGVTFNAQTTGALLSSFSGTGGSSQANVIVPAGDHMMMQIPRSATGYSVIAGAAGLVSVAMWTRKASTSTG